MTRSTRFLLLLSFLASQGGTITAELIATNGVRILPPDGQTFTPCETNAFYVAAINSDYPEYNIPPIVCADDGTGLRQLRASRELSCDCSSTCLKECKGYPNGKCLYYDRDDNCSNCLLLSCKRRLEIVETTGLETIPLPGDDAEEQQHRELGKAYGKQCQELTAAVDAGKQGMIDAVGGSATKQAIRDMFSNGRASCVQSFKETY
jgi:hypothetical protein